MLHTLNFYKAVCQLYLNKLENNTDKQQKNRINVPLHNKREKKGYHRRQGSEQALTTSLNEWRAWHKAGNTAAGLRSAVAWASWS